MTDYPDPPDVDEAVAAGMAQFEPDIRPPTSTPIGAHIVNWRTLSPADAPAAWGRLRDWVEWFTVRYGISESLVPPCWYRHGQLVEELSALHTAHTAAFDPTDTGFGPIGWHEHLSIALPRLSRAYSGGCVRGHDPLRPRTWAQVVDESEWDAWTSQAHAHGDPAEAPQQGRKPQ